MYMLQVKKLIILFNNPISLDFPITIDTKKCICTVWQVASAYVASNKSIQHSKFAEIIRTRNIQLPTLQQHTVESTNGCCSLLATHTHKQTVNQLV